MTKVDRIKELLMAERTEGWDNSQFWEAQIILNSIPERESTKLSRTLLYVWTDEEERRIENGIHEGCSPELEAELMAKWPIQL